MNATARNPQRDADRVATMADTFSYGGAPGRNGDTRSDIPDDEHLRQQQAKAALDIAASVTR